MKRDDTMASQGRGLTRQKRQKCSLTLTTAGTNHTPSSVTCSAARLPQLQPSFMRRMPGAIGDPVSSLTP